MNVRRRMTPGIGSPWCHEYAEIWLNRLLAPFPDPLFGVPMQIRFHCPTPSCVALIQFEPLAECGGAIRCPRCKENHPIRLTESVTRHGVVDACPVCGCRELFTRKDFPQRLGLVVVAAAALLSIALFNMNVVWSWGVLAAAVVVDFLLYLAVGRVTVCYACRAEFRHARPNPAHEGFDLARSEKY